MQFSTEDNLLFQYLYDYRTLSLQQAWQAAFAHKYSNASQDWFDIEIAPLMNAGLLALKPNSFAGYRLELTGPGIGALCKMKGLPRVWHNEKGTKLPTLKYPSQLLIEDHLAAHQLSLNQFLLDFRDVWAIKYGHDAAFSYVVEVEQLSDKYDYFRPDAEITITSSDSLPLHLYIEQDMGQESRKMMRLKWERYRRFISAMHGEQNFGSMIMLFIVNYDTSMPAPHHLDFSNMPWCIEYRKRDVFLSMPYLYSSMLDGFFDAYTGTETEILNCTFRKLLPYLMHTYTDPTAKWLSSLDLLNGAVTSPASSLSDKFGGVKFANFSRVLVNGLIKNNTAYVSDDMAYLPASVFAKATHMQRVNQTLHGLVHNAPEIVYLLNDGGGIIRDGLHRLQTDVGVVSNPQYLYFA